MSSKTRKAAIDDEEWERVKPIVRQLYLVDGKTQKDTLEILREYHDFHPSKAQLERKLKQWRMARNMTGPEWKCVDRVIRQRQSHGKRSQLYLSGIPLRPAAIEKARSRHCYETAFEKCRSVPGPSFPEDLPLIVRTPSPMEQRRRDCYQVVPWLESMDFLKGLTLMIPRAKRGADNAFQFLGVGLLAIVPSYVHGALPHAAQLQWTYHALQLIMPGRSQEDHITRAEAIWNQPYFGNQEALETVFFLLSNNFLDKWSNSSIGKSVEIIDFLFDLLHKSSGWAVITSQPYSELPLSLRAILDRLFKEAVDRFDLKAVRFLLQAGVDINLRFTPQGMLREGLMTWSMSPFEYATMSCNTTAVAFFVSHGADTEFCNNSLHNLPDLFDKLSRENKDTLSLAKLFLSYFAFHTNHEPEVRLFLHEMERMEKSPVPEAFIEFFRGKFVAHESIAQLIITAIRAKSTLVSSLLLQYPEHIDKPNLYGVTPLMAAAGVGDLQLCELLLRLGASLEIHTKQSMQFNTPTPLQYAAYYADATMVRLFLDSGAQINFQHPTDALRERESGASSYHDVFHSLDAGWHGWPLRSVGRTALQAALLGRNEDTAQLLLAEGAVFFGEELTISIRTGLSNLISSSWNIQAHSMEKTVVPGLLTSTLEAAIIAGNYGMALHELNKSPLCITPEALYAAIWFMDLKTTSGIAFVRRILEQGTGLRHSTEHWIGTAMSLAAELGSIEVVELMLSCGLRPKSCLPMTEDYLFSPIWQQRSDSGTVQNQEVYLSLLSRLLRQYDVKGVWPMLDEAANKGLQEYLDLLLNNGYEPTASCAVRVAHRNTSTSVATLQSLHRRGLKMTHCVLSGSILRANTASIEWLLSLGLDLNEEIRHTSRRENEESFTRTAVQAAAQMGNLALIDKLVSQGADINAPAYYHGGVTALQVASIEGYFDLVRKLLELGADPNAVGAEMFGRTALEGAAEHGRLDIVQLLLDSDVATEGQGRRQYVRAIAFAKQGGHAAVMTLLRSHRTWTEDDQEISDEDRLLYWDQTSQKDADDQSASLDQNVEDGREHQLDAACYDPHQLPVEPIPALTYEASESFGQADCGRSIGYSEDGYIKSEMESLGVIHGEAQLAAASGTQESLREAENDFHPSGIFDQVKEDLELTGEGDGIWIEAYNAFSLETMC